MLSKLLSVCGPTGLFHSDLSAESGEVRAQPRKDCLSTKPRSSISEEARLPQGAEGQSNAGRGRGSSGSVVSLRC